MDQCLGNNGYLTDGFMLDSMIILRQSEKYETVSFHHNSYNFAIESLELKDMKRSE